MRHAAEVPIPYDLGNCHGSANVVGRNHLERVPRQWKIGFPNWTCNDPPSASRNSNHERNDAVSRGPNPARKPAGPGNEPLSPATQGKSSRLVGGGRGGLGG